MTGRSFFFAGGGTGGHIYPSIAVAEQIVKLEPEAKIHFFVSTREIDTQILTQTGLRYSQLPAKGFSVRPDKLIDFGTSFVKSCRIAKRMVADRKDAVVIGAGGFVAAPVCWAAHRLKIAVALLNVDILPGRASKMIAGWVEEIFVQFDET
ncbi:MAG: glycosyltransferase, partial [Planctomycetota bacterium]